MNKPRIFFGSSAQQAKLLKAMSISRDRDGGLNVSGRAWQEDGTLSARYWSEAAKSAGIQPASFYFWKGERPRHPNAPQLEGTGEIKVVSADRATGYSRHGPIATPSSMPEPPVSTFERTPLTSICSTAGPRTSGPSSSLGASRSGSRSRTHSGSGWSRRRSFEHGGIGPSSRAVQSIEDGFGHPQAAQQSLA